MRCLGLFRDIAVKETRISISKEVALEADFYHSESGANPERLVIVCHGFSAHRRFAFLPMIGKELSQSGFSCLIPDFSRNGMDAKTGRFVDPAGFSQNTFENERQELVNLIIRLREEESLGAFKQFTLIGHSRGGVTALGAAADIRVAECISGVSAWSTPSGTEPTRFGLTDAHREIWQKMGTLLYPIERLGVEAPLGIEVLEDMEADPNRVQRFVQALSRPLQVIHGTADVRVPIACGERIASWSQQATFVPIEGADHVFQCSSEQRTSAYLELALHRLKDFLMS